LRAQEPVEHHAGGHVAEVLADLVTRWAAVVADLDRGPAPKTGRHSSGCRSRGSPAIMHETDA